MNSQGIGMTSARTRARLRSRLQTGGITDESVLQVMTDIPRHLFIDEALASRAYDDDALPIGLGQTISRPYVVARMTEALLADGPLKRVLEVGGGCGYQTAVLSRLVKEVYSVERLQPLLVDSRRRLRQLGYFNIQYHLADGGWGWDAQAPFDGILVAAAAEAVPAPLLTQLANKGRMVIPVGSGEQQDLLLYTRSGDEFECRLLESANFVPLVSSSTSGGGA